jgi:L-alanine-DL-glutamate epimerase-like enolase superfamily enzyme
MEITHVTTIGLRGATVDGGWPKAHGVEDNLHTLVEVHTDEGLAGWGSCYTSKKLVDGAIELLRPILIGMPANEPERVAETLRQKTFWQGRGGSVEHAISGIDIALWDLFGKAAGQSVSRLLGGRYRDRIRPYASILFDEPGPLAEYLSHIVARGFRAVKLGWRPFGRRDRKFDELLVRTARETVGPDIDILVDAGGSEEFWPHDFHWAKETAKMLADYEVGWFEEALAPDDIDGYVQLRRVSPVPIAAGEVLTRRQSFMPFLSRGAVDIIQPDVTKCGGLSEGRRIGWLADDQGILLVPHGWNTAVGVAADLQLVAALPVARYVEYLTPCAYIDDLLTGPFKMDREGFLSIPDGPGLGIELNREALARYAC